MTMLKVFTLVMPLLFLTSQINYAQGVTEYGRILGDVGQRQGKMNPKAPGTLKRQEKDKGGVQGMSDVASTRLPSSLTVQSQWVALHARHDEGSGKVAHLSQGEKLVPVIQTDGGNALWYMVKTQTGTMRWVKASDVREDTVQKKE